MTDRLDQALYGTPDDVAAMQQLLDECTVHIVADVAGRQLSLLRASTAAGGRGGASSAPDDDDPAARNNNDHNSAFARVPGWRSLVAGNTAATAAGG